MTPGNLAVKVVLPPTNRQSTDEVTVRLAGELDIDTVGQAGEKIDEVIISNPGGGLALDLAELEFIDSSGLHLVASIGRKVSSLGFKLRVVRASDLVRRAFEVVGLDAHVELVNPPS